MYSGVNSVVYSGVALDVGFYLYAGRFVQYLCTIVVHIHHGRLYVRAYSAVQIDVQ